MSKNCSSQHLKLKIDLLQRLISIALASCNIKEIKINQKHRVWRTLYPPISIYILAGYGSLKSTMLQEVSKITGQPVLKKVTAAGLVGSIGDDGKTVISPVWNHRRTLMLIDEFNASGENAKDTKQALLDISEKGEYSKIIGRKAKKKINKKDDDLFFRVEEGQISFKTRCGVIMCTMMRHKIDTFHSALLSRCIPITYEIDDPDIIFNGELDFKFKKIKVPEKVEIKLKDWNVITKAAKDYSTNDVVRAASMLARIYAVIGKHDDKLYQIICGLRNDITATTLNY